VVHKTVDIPVVIVIPRPPAEALAAGKWQVSVISWSPAELLMFIWVLNPLKTQRSYKTRKSAAAAAVVSAVVAGRNGLEPIPFQTMSAQERELDTVPELHCGASCCCFDGDPDPAGQAALTSLPVSGGGAVRGQTSGGR
jgi:hypothetical protein